MRTGIKENAGADRGIYLGNAQEVNLIEKSDLEHEEISALRFLVHWMVVQLTKIGFREEKQTEWEEM